MVHRRLLPRTRIENLHRVQECPVVLPRGPARHHHPPVGHLDAGNVGPGHHQVAHGGPASLNVVLQKSDVFKRINLTYTYILYYIIQKNGIEKCSYTRSITYARGDACPERWLGLQSNKKHIGT